MLWVTVIAGRLDQAPLISGLGPACYVAEDRSSSAGCAVVTCPLLSKTWVTLCPSTVTEPMLFSPVSTDDDGPAGRASGRLQHQVTAAAAS